MAKSRVAACSLLPPILRPWEAPIPTLDPTLARLAWEFLRRNAQYRVEYAGVQSGAVAALSPRWGLKTAIDPDRDDVDATAIWRLVQNDEAADAS